MPSSRQDRDIVLRYQTGFERMRVAAAKRAAMLWRLLGGVDERSERLFVPTAIAASAGFETATSLLVAGYLSTFVSDAKITPKLNIRDVDPAEVFTRPIVVARTALSEGKRFTEAMSLAQTRAEDLFGTNVVLAQRDAMVQGAESSKDIVGYERVLSGNSCDLCATASTQRYHTDELMPIHDHCDCSVAPIVGERDPGRVINKDRLESLKEADIAVHEHRELGPVLTDASHKFSTV